MNSRLHATAITHSKPCRQRDRALGQLRTLETVRIVESEA